MNKYYHELKEKLEEVKRVKDLRVKDIVSCPRCNAQPKEQCVKPNETECDIEHWTRARKGIEKRKEIETNLLNEATELAMSAMDNDRANRNKSQETE